jgi:hypothetical protein
MSTSKRAKLKKPSQEITTLETLKAYLGIQRDVDDWDAILIPSSCASDWDGQGAGWACIMVERNDLDGDPPTWRQSFKGGINIGDKSTATLMAILHPIIYLTNACNVSRPGGYHLYVVSSSEYLIKGLEKNNPVWHSQLAKNRELWMAIYAAKRRGIVIHPRLIAKEKLELEKLSHDIATKEQDAQACYYRDDQTFIEIEMKRLNPDQERVEKLKG